MSTTTLDGLVINDSGAPILPDASDFVGRKAFFREVLKTKAGQRLAEIGITDGAERRIAEVGERWYGANAEITLDKLAAIVTALLDAHDPALVPLPEVEVAPAVDNRPRNTDGTFKSEFQQFADSHSVADARSRANVDRAFGDWWRAQYAAQNVTEGVFKIVGAPPERSATQADRSLLETFALAYSRTSMDQIRKPIGGVVTLSDGSRHTVTELRAKVEAAAKVGLI
jgi:hypothetical protein